MPCGKCEPPGRTALDEASAACQTRAMTDQIIVLAISLMWIAFCMRFWYVINRENVWQRRLIAIGAGLGGGMIYILGTMALEVIHAAKATETEEREPPAATIRVQGRPE